MKLADYIKLQFSGKKVTVYKGGKLSDPIIYEGMSEDLEDADILNMEVIFVSGAADQEVGVRFFV